MKLRKSSKKGFTLIELIVVIAILGILAAILVPTITGFIDQARNNTDVANAKMLYTSGVLAVSTDTALTTYVANMPVPQGSAHSGTFAVYNVVSGTTNTVSVWIATTSTTGLPFNASSATFGASATLPASSAKISSGSLPTITAGA
jgi:type IV pilus assembly protein PilA